MIWTKELLSNINHYLSGESEDNMEFSINDPIKKVIDHPFTKDLHKWLNPVSSSFTDLSAQTILNASFKELAVQTKTWDSDLIVRSINTLISNRKEGIKVQHFFYDDEEIEKDPGKKKTGLLFYPGKPQSPFVCIIPGGGYYRVSTLHEGTGIAQALNDKGYSAFILLYRVEEEGFPKPMEDLSRAIAYILDNAEQLRINPQNYAVMGFSAGGHLAASFGTKSLGYQHYSLPKPKALLLGYPVVTMGEFTHEGSRDMLLGKNPSEEMIEKTSIEKQVDKDYPDTYMWHCRKDGAVNVANSENLLDNLRIHQIRSRLDIYECDVHGWGLAPGTLVEGWFDKAIDFWQAD